MFTRYGVSWRIVRSCFRLLRTYSDLLLFPILTVILIAFIIAITAAGILLWVNFDLRVFAQLTGWQHTLLTFLYYVASYCLGIYTNTAMVTVVLQILARQPVDMRAGWRLANERIWSILGYALIMATVGIVLRLLLKPLGKMGAFLSPVFARTAAFTFIGLAWNLVPYFVVPVLIAENPGSFPAIRRSSGLIRQRWGENVVVNASVWLIFALPLAVVLVLGTPAIGWAFIYLDEWRITWVVYIVVMLVLLTFLFKMAMDAIFAAVAYRYATTGEIHDYFYEDDLHVAFVNRPNRMANSVRNWSRRGWRQFKRQSHSTLPSDEVREMASPIPLQEQNPELPGKAAGYSGGDNGSGLQ